MQKELTHIDLFSGIGGFTLAGEWAGFRTIVFCEKEEFCQKVLKKHWPEVPIIEEIRDLDGTKYRGATLLTGGFPCQPFSVAGQRRGKEDDRYLWPEMLRVISEAKPHWILAENVPGIFHMALDTVLADLEGEGYATGTFIIPACGLNAPHRRNRVWIIANSKAERSSRSIIKEDSQKKIQGGMANISGKPNCSSRHIWDAADSRKQKRNRLSDIGGQKVAEIRRENQVDKHSNSYNAQRSRKESDSEDSFRLYSGENSAWEENWLEVAANLLRVDDGFFGWFYLYREGINNATTIKNLSRQNLQELQKIIQQKEISERMGRLWQIPQEGTLFPILCELQIRANRPNYISSQGENLSGGFLRSVWDEGKSRSASQKWRHSREHRREHTNTLPSVPYEIALEIKEAWDCISYLQDAIRADRVNRLKALGNAIVPQIAYEIMKNIAWIENEKSVD